MAMKENFISMAPDEESNAKVTPIDNNKTLMIDQYTSNVEPGNPELVEDIWTINDAFAHFKPSVEVDFIEEEGGSVIQQCIITVAEELTGAFLVLVREVRLGGSTWDAQVVQVAVG